MYRSWRGRDLDCVTDVVGNAKDTFVDLTPASNAPAEATRAKWAALLPGQTVPLLWERVTDAESCSDQ